MCCARRDRRMLGREKKNVDFYSVYKSIHPYTFVYRTQNAHYYYYYYYYYYSYYYYYYYYYRYYQA